MRRGIKVQTVFIWVYQHTHAFVLGLMLSAGVKKQSFLPPFSPNSTFHHHWSIPSINGRVCPQSIPICLLCSSSCLSPSLRIHLSSFFTLSPCVPVAPPHTLLPHTPRSQGVAPSKVIHKQQLAEKSILYQQATKGLLHLSYMILVVKASKHPSPPLVRSLSSVAKTIRRKKRGMKRGGGAEGVKESGKGIGDCAGSRGSLL